LKPEEQPGVIAMRLWGLALALLLGGILLAACKPAAKEAYKVGYTADVTGPGASTWAPILEGFRLYLQRLNAAGGVNGHPIELIAEDNRSLPTRAAAHAKKFIEEDKVHMIILSSASVTYAPVITEAEKAGTPMVVLHSGCPRESLPPTPKKTVFCFGFSPILDSQFQVNAIKKLAKTPVKWAGVAIDVPISRAGIDAGEEAAKKAGFEVVTKEVIPLGPPNLSPHAARIIAAGANWAQGWGTWEHTGGPMLVELRKQGWKGNYIAMAAANIEEEMRRIKDDGLFIVSPVALFVDNLPVHREIAAAAQRFGTPFGGSSTTYGWIMGMIAEEAFRRCGWPCSTGKLISILEKQEVNTKGLTPEAFKWTPTDHFGPISYRVYRWDSSQGKIIRVIDWSKPK